MIPDLFSTALPREDAALPPNPLYIDCRQFCCFICTACPTGDLGVAVRLERAVELGRIDLDYFDEDED
jgi:hypothetical protein